MATYLSPGVYVKEVSSGSAPIAGAGTSTAAFIGVVPDKITIPNIVLANQITNEVVGSVPETIPASIEFKLKQYPVNTSTNTYTIKIDGKEIPGVTIQPDDKNRIAKFTLTLAQMTDLTKKTITADYQVTFPTFQPVPSGEVKLCTNFKEFKNFFGDFSEDKDQKQLAHAVYGFFNNGGTRCYVMRVNDKADITDTLLEKLEAIDEIAIVAAPGNTSPAERTAIITHCQNTGDRFAILDYSEDDTSANITTENKPDNSNYAAFYFPWIQVFDPATKTANPDGDGLIYVPPSGHIAGIYARVDAERGVHKAPANEIVLGALGLKQNLSKNQQDGLNPKGINCIRNLNGNIRVWGARTIGGDKNGEFKYINVRRLFNYLKKSIDQGTQWTVFEPNSPELWAKIRRNVTSFLMTVWRSGALFGNTPEQAFYVKCDEETNPPELREQGQVITEIGVAIVKPAEFVIFNLSQWAGPGK